METIGNTNDNHILLKATREEVEALAKLESAVNGRGFIHSEHYYNFSGNLSEAFKFMLVMAYNYNIIENIKESIKNLDESFRKTEGVDLTEE